MSLTTQSAKRRTSFVESEANPFEIGSAASLEGGSVLNIESLADTVKIEKDDLNALIASLESVRLALSL
jgi:hypothetical protein